LAEEFTEGSAFDSMNTRAGLEVKPWAGARLSTTLNQSAIKEYGPRTFAEMGLTQGLLLGERWSVDFGIDGSRSLHESSTPPPVASPGHPFASGGVLGQGTLTEDFVALSAGATYRAPSWSWNGRAELRDGERSKRQGLISGFLSQPSGGVGLSASGQVFRVEQDPGNSALSATLDLGLALRPLASGYALLERLELRYDSLDGGSGAPGPLGGIAVRGDARSRRIVNNLSLNRVSGRWDAQDARGNPFVLDQRSQWAVYYGSKYAFDDFQGVDYRGYTDLLGFEWRFDLTPVWDLGLQGSQLHVWDSDQYSYAVGPSVGYTPATNGWVSVGYNLAGFRDRDFEAARYTAQGPYLKLRFKFDQQTLGRSDAAPAGVAPSATP
ncbi:MAG TPA: hypothetical protein VM074_08860, partial [Solimonas sp.]|nr:hypothetical protein [Solimonas sp.]